MADNGTMAEAIVEQAKHASASRRIDRTGWDRDEWIQDAERLMGDPHGSVMSLVNGHVMALLAEVRELRKEREIH